MSQNMREWLLPPAIERLVLLINHVLMTEPAAMSRLAQHDGRVIAIEPQPSAAWLPAMPTIRVRITPPGLLEWCGLAEAGDADLVAKVDATNPPLLAARLLSGDALPLTIAGDAALATDVQWLVDNLRWDVEADLEQWFGPVVARQLGRVGESVAAAVRGLAAASARGPRAGA